MMVLGDARGPFLGVVLARGFFARMLYPGMLPRDRRVWRRIKRGKRWTSMIFVAEFYPLAQPQHGLHGDTSQAARWFWFSDGYHKWTRLEWIGLWFRAMRTKLRYGGARIPQARVVNIGARHDED